MKTSIVSPGISLDHGIDSIAHETYQPAKLPERADIPPPEDVGRSHLDSLLYPNTIDNYVDDELIPELADAAIMMPANFRAALKDVIKSLQEAAVAYPDSAKQFGNTANVLAKDEKLRELLQTYCSALYAG